MFEQSIWFWRTSRRSRKCARTNHREQRHAVRTDVATRLRSSQTCFPSIRMRRPRGTIVRESLTGGDLTPKGGCVQRAIRVHELARELALTSGQVMAKLAAIGEFVKSPSSIVRDSD